MIKVEQLSKTFPSGKTAVDKLDLVVSTGEIFALLGPNGAGKTTTIRILSTLAGFDSGKVRVADLDVDTEPDAVRASIGLVAQNTGIDYFLTGRENMHLCGQLYHMPAAKIRERTAELAQYFGLTDALDKTVMTYSGGMRRKLDIATALIHSPKLLFLDEPTLGLDISSRHALWQYIERMNREFGLTILLTTHYLEEADKLSHRVGIINNGKISVIGTPKDLKDSIGGDALTLTFAQRQPQHDQLVSTLQNQGLVSHFAWENNRVRLYVEDGTNALPKVATLAAQQGIELDSLSVARPTLDDVFLRYTGTSLDGKSNGEGQDEWWKQWAGKASSDKWQKWQKQWENTDNAAAPENVNNATNVQPAWQEEAAKWQQPQDAPAGSSTSVSAATKPSQTQTEAGSDWQSEAAKWRQSDNATDTKTDTNKSWPQESGDWQKWRQKSDKDNPQR